MKKYLSYIFRIQYEFAEGNTAVYIAGIFITIMACLLMTLLWDISFKEHVFTIKNFLMLVLFILVNNPIIVAITVLFVSIRWLCKK